VQARAGRAAPGQAEARGRVVPRGRVARGRRRGAGPGERAEAGGTGGAYGGGSAGTARAGVRGARAAPERARRAGDRAAREPRAQGDGSGLEWAAGSSGWASSAGASERAAWSADAGRAGAAARVSAGGAMQCWWCTLECKCWSGRNVASASAGLVADAGACEVEQRAARSERARRGNRRGRALALGERGSWAGTGIGASTAQMQAA
jgi:hypothetical protein